MKNNYLDYKLTSNSMEVSEKCKAIINWVIKNSSYFDNSHFTKIIINIKNENVVGEINIFPDHKM